MRQAEFIDVTPDLSVVPVPTVARIAEFLDHVRERSRDLSQER